MAALSGGMLCIGSGSTSQGEPGEAHLSVEGTLLVHATRADETVMIRVEDEAGGPVPDAEVSVQDVEVSACVGRPHERTGGDGGVCVRIGSVHSGHALVLASKPHFTSARFKLDLQVNQAAPEVSVWPRLVDLDRDERHTIELGPVYDGPLRLTLVCDDQERTLYEAPVDAAPRLRVELGTSAFRESFGSCQMNGATGGLSSSAVPLMLSTTAVLRLERVEVTERDRIEATIGVQTSVGPLESGVVESRHDGSVRVAASVHGGRAKLSFASYDAERALIVSYLSADPAIRNGQPLQIELPRLSPRRPSRLWLSLPLLAFAGWLGLRLRRSPTRFKIEPLNRRRESRSAPSTSLEQRLHGVVFDVDTHERIGGAEVVLQRVEATHRTILFQTRSGPDGAFVLPEIWRGQVDWEITCAAAAYDQQRVRPDGSTVRIGLIAEHRALLRTLVKWAKASGWWPRDARPLPTPLDLALRAGQAGRLDVEKWAVQVNAHVYGSDLPRAQSSSELLEPPPFDALR